MRFKFTKFDNSRKVGCPVQVLGVVGINSRGNNNKLVKDLDDPAIRPVFLARFDVKENKLSGLFCV